MGKPKPKLIRKRCLYCNGHSYTIVHLNGTKGSGAIHSEGCEAILEWPNTEIIFDRPELFTGSLPKKKKPKTQVNGSTFRK